MGNTLSTKNQATFDQVFEHPISQDLQWQSLRELFEGFGEVHDENSGNLRVTVGDHSSVFPFSSPTEFASVEDVVKIQHFLNDAQVSGTAEVEGDFLLVIDHQEALIFSTESKDAVPVKVTPHDPQGHLGQVHSGRSQFQHTDQKNLNRYFGEVTKALAGADRILVFGSGSSSSSAVALFVAWLEKSNKNLAERVVGSHSVDLSHMTHGQLLAKAREIYQV
ncbi:MAG: hypothetical protein K8R88_09125 [Armatimonadetes bacterium]|nr:hypothetical protein [Armatimonadota bacterium]